MLNNIRDNTAIYLFKLSILSLVIALLGAFLRSIWIIHFAALITPISFFLMSGIHMYLSIRDISSFFKRLYMKRTIWLFFTIEFYADANRPLLLGVLFKQSHLSHLIKGINKPKERSDTYWRLKQTQ